VHREPGGVVAKHRGLWSPRREFESLPGYIATNQVFLNLWLSNKNRH
jgi:hypothetical protein